MSKKTDKPNKSQVAHIKAPFVDKSGEPKSGNKVYNTVKGKTAKYAGTCKTKGVKLKK